ncbi:MAG TPA: bis(5'-nucleosyl)-tetraphosphatase (symmetrical) YqeK [bacterium]|nr:bis(5'-nucleosyl)-tetraphosphatase (symmetrical) YqeK [bacterium]HOL46820.1 bis(5'-nucleosyl)-tetraphosphatase (symmetrical) YqeK [bacterium]HPQ18654.1 bis(5'-nucleosyl)-tetraphosphatase (symmetrical) YqeK [bacterium]
MKNFINELKNSKWWKNLPDKRKQHTEYVVEAAIKYNKEFNLNLEKEEIIKAAYLHDIGKSIKKDDYKKFIKENKIKIKKSEKKSLSFWHAPISEFISKKYFKIKNKNILKAIRYHTTAKANMPLLSKLIYFSDFMALDRNLTLHQEINNNLNKGLNKLLYIILTEKIKYLLTTNSYIHPNIIKFRNKIIEEINK